MFRFHSVLFFIILIQASKCSALDFEAKIIENGIELSDRTNILSRHRRELLFPEGSSLQLVYDQIIGMVGSTNLHIFGVTCALAWQLPHEIIDDEEYDEVVKETHGEVKVEGDKLKTSADVNIITTVTDDNNTSTDGPSPSERYDYYHRNNYHNYKMNNNYYDYLRRIANQYKPPMNRYYFGPNPYSKSNSNSYSRYKDRNTNNQRWNYDHRVYPALRMRRSLDSKADGTNSSRTVHPEVKRFLNRHRDTRFDLYKTIEKYLDAKGMNGQDCIKRALCETTQMGANDLNSESQPNNFIKEIMRTIFSLPTGRIHSSGHSKKNKYDAVVNEIDENIEIDCRKKFPECATSIWSEDFIF